MSALRRQPKELSDLEVVEIALRVRKRMNDKFGSAAILQTFNSPIGIELVKATYIAVREQLEKEHDSARSNT